jgi:hypothetical protein
MPEPGRLVTKGAVVFMKMMAESRTDIWSVTRLAFRPWDGCAAESRRPHRRSHPPRDDDAEKLRPLRTVPPDLRGYPIDHAQLPGDRKFGWQLDATALASRTIPPEPLTFLEVAAFNVGRDLLRVFEGTVLWTGIESLRTKLERNLPAELVAHAEKSRRVFHVSAPDAGRYAARPRLLSALSRAISDCREIEVEARADGPEAASRRRLRPMMLVVSLSHIQLAARDVTEAHADPAVLIDLDRIAKVTTLDTTFTPEPIDPARVAFEA